MCRVSTQAEAEAEKGWRPTVCGSVEVPRSSSCLPNDGLLLFLRQRLATVLSTDSFVPRHVSRSIVDAETKSRDVMEQAVEHERATDVD